MFACQAEQERMLRLFGEKVRLLRIHRGLSQAELADRVGLARHTHISHIEANRRVPSLELFLQISEVLGVATDYLLRDSITKFPPLLPELKDRHFVVPPHLFNAKLRYLRLQRAMTQDALAEAIGLTSQGY